VGRVEVFRCPGCGLGGPFRVVVPMPGWLSSAGALTFDVLDDVAVDLPLVCAGCGARGTVATFSIDTPLDV